jgi:hypothetical protein
MPTTQLAQRNQSVESAALKPFINNFDKSKSIIITYMQQIE